MTAEEILFKALNVAVDNGKTMGATDDYIRINLCGYSGDLAEFLNRLAKSKKYNANDLLLPSVNHCTHITIRSSDTRHYVANPNDCNIDIDAQYDNVQITLPQFINYQYSNPITISKMDNTNHQVIVKTNKSTVVLEKKDKQLRIQWTQPFFMNGQWRIIQP
jgi:hypothetical protein